MNMNKLFFAISHIKDVLKDARIGIAKGILNNYSFFNIYEQQYKSLLSLNGFDDKPAPGELEFQCKWGGVNNVEPYSYRFFLNYVTNPGIIISEGIAHLKIESSLNSKRHNDFYSDKNSYDLFLQDVKRPKTLLRRNGDDLLMNDKYEVVANCNDSSLDFKAIFNGCPTIIIKPSVDSCSGIGVEKFVLENSEYKSQEGALLTVEYLKKNYSHFIIQSGVIQSDIISRFCHSAVNTLRLCLYRSVVNGNWKITASVIRIGKEGKVVDNAHSGGGMVKIDLKSGKLGNKVMFSNGQSVSLWNDIDYSSSEFFIPNWDAVKNLALSVAQKYYGFHLIAMDICLDANNEPVLIEVNTNQFSFWIPLYFNFDVFDGELDYILNKLI